MSIETQTLDPKEQNRANFLRRNRKQDHGTRSTHTFEHDYRSMDRQAATEATNAVAHRMGLHAIQEVLNGPRPSETELEAAADKFLIEAGEDVETFHIPVAMSEDSDGTDIEVHLLDEDEEFSYTFSDHPQGDNAADLEKEFKAHLKRSGKNAYTRRDEHDDQPDYLDGFSIKHRP